MYILEHSSMINVLSNCIDSTMDTDANLKSWTIIHGRWVHWVKIHTAFSFHVNIHSLISFSGIMKWPTCRTANLVYFMFMTVYYVVCSTVKYIFLLVKYTLTLAMPAGVLMISRKDLRLVRTFELLLQSISRFDALRDWKQIINNHSVIKNIFK